MAAKAISMASSRNGRARDLVSGAGVGAGGGVPRPKIHRDVAVFPRSFFDAGLLRSAFDADFPRSDPDFGAGFRRPAFAARARNAVRTMRPSPFQLLFGAARLPPMGR
jgi:hypothetical protein